MQHSFLCPPSEAEGNRGTYLYDVQARLGVLQHRQLLVDVHEADLIWVGTLTHQIDDLLK